MKISVTTVSNSLIDLLSASQLALMKESAENHTSTTVVVQNLCNQDIFIESNGIATIEDGLRLEPGASFYIEEANFSTLNLISAVVTSQDVRILFNQTKLGLIPPSNKAPVGKRIVNNKFIYRTGEIENLSAPSLSGSVVVDVVNGATFGLGDKICIKEVGVTSNGVFEVRGVSVNALSLDGPTDRDYTTAATVEKVYENMAAVGLTAAASPANPTSFRVAPPAGEVWHIFRFIVTMTDGLDMDLTKFAGITGGIPNGLVGRARIDGDFFNFSNWKTNRDISQDMFDFDFVDKAGGGNYGAKGRGTFEKMGSVIDLIGDTGDFIEILAQDNLESILDLEINTQGHECKV